MAKTILKLYANGDFEAVGVTIYQNENLFVRENTQPGYISSTGEILPQEQDARYSEFIPIIAGETYTIRFIWNITEYFYSWAEVRSYDSAFNMTGLVYQVDLQGPRDLTWSGIFPPDTAYVRITINHIENNLSSVHMIRGISVIDGVKFNENSLTVPKIIEYPPPNYRNYFIEKTSVSGYVDDVSLGVLQPPNEHDRTSDFISVLGWGNAIVCLRFNDMDASYQAWAAISFFDESKQFLSMAREQTLTEHATTGDLIVEIPITVDVAFMRVSVNYYDNPNTDVKLSVEKGTTATQKHYLALEDMPEWVKDTGQPISIFKEGIVIKGDLIQTNS